MLDMTCKYYVYEWIRLDINEPFYVGKGTGDRWRILTRGNNQHFNNIVKSIPVAVNILEDNLDEKTSYEYEIYYIELYRDIGYELTNISSGGEKPPTGSGEKNNNFGKKWCQETRDRFSEYCKEARLGKANPNSKRIMCLETGEIFDTISEAVQGLSDGKLSLGNMTPCFKQPSKTFNGYHVINDRIYDFDNYMDEQSRFKLLIESYLSSPNKVFCIDLITKEIFPKNYLIKTKITNEYSFNKFIKNNDRYMLLIDYYNSRYSQ